MRVASPAARSVLVSLEFVLPVSMRTPILRVIATVGFFGIIIGNWRTANRWARERSSGIRVIRSANPVVIEPRPETVSGLR